MKSNLSLLAGALLAASLIDPEVGIESVNHEDYRSEESDRRNGAPDPIEESEEDADEQEAADDDRGDLHGR